MIRCKLCDTLMDTKHRRRDGSLMCPVCGQIYWREAVLKAMAADEVPAPVSCTETRHGKAPRMIGRHTITLKTVPITAR